MTQNTLEVIGFLAAVRAQGRGASVSEISQVTGVSRSSVYRIVKVLENDKIVRKHGTAVWLDTRSWLVSLIGDAIDEFHREYLGAAKQGVAS